MLLKKCGLMMALSLIFVEPLLSEITEQPLEQVGYIEEDDDVANAASRERNDIDFYDKNRDQVRERRRREAIREYRAVQHQQYCCPEGERPEDQNGHVEETHQQ